MKHVLCPTERALQGGCITKPFTENKKPEGPSKCRVIAGFSGVRLSQRCHQPGYGSPGQNPPHVLPDTPPEPTHGSSNPPCSGGGSGAPGCCTSGSCRAHIWQLQSSASLLSGTRGPAGTIRAGVLLPCLLPLGLAGALSCWMLHKEQPEVLKFPSRPARSHPQHPAAERANPARLILILSSFQLIKASRHPAEDSLPVSLGGKAGP